MLRTKRRASAPGFLLIEVLLGLAVFAIFMGGIGLTILLGQDTTVAGGDRIRAAALTEQALEGARNIRDDDFNRLTTGSHGIVINSSGQWVMSGSAVRTTDGYRTFVTISTVSGGWLQVVARTDWKHGRGRSGSVLLTGEITNWRNAPNVGNWSSLTLEGGYTDAGTPLFNDIAVLGNYAYVSSETSAGGVGLYVFDISNLASPTRVSSAFFLGTAGYQLIAAGTTLYILTGDVNGELRAYDISAPTSLDGSDLLDDYNLPGSGLGASLTLDGTTLYVGARESGAASRDELYSFDVTNPSAISLRDSLNDTGTNADIALSGTSAYLASSMDSMELRLADVENPADLRIASGGGYNVTDVQDGNDIAVTGTSALLGRVNGSAIEELVLFDIGRNPLPTSPPGPWYYEVGGGVHGLAMDPTECYAFLASDFDSEELQVVRIQDHALPEVSYYDAATGAGRGLLYEGIRDRVFLLTNRSVHIFRPGALPSGCP